MAPGSGGGHQRHPQARESSQHINPTQEYQSTDLHQPNNPGELRLLHRDVQRGFRVVGRTYDDTTLAIIENMNYETPYALLNSISQKYRVFRRGTHEQTTGSGQTRDLNYYLVLTPR